ncbi:MAG: pirin family protein [Candidatus Omnitrophica bacterium]|nr:pirin family protein [Candidatus Omnitrophota bacterium]
MSKITQVNHISVRRSFDRGRSHYDWLDSRHTFSFADYHDPSHMGYRSLRVINEDVVSPGSGFGMHAHKDMEILTYVIDGSLRHRDSMRHQTIIASGSLQKITAGRGIFHSEYNASDKGPVHFLQVWIMPDRNGLVPGYSELTLPRPDISHPMLLIGSSLGGNGETRIEQDVFVYRGVLRKDLTVSHGLGKGRGTWIQVIKGRVALLGEILLAGDGAAVEDVPELNIGGIQDSEFLLFDLA